ncbi:MAG: site-2 protease family protein [Thermoplasmatota archaeon]
MVEMQDVRALVERHFRVYDHRQDRLPGGAPAQLFYLMFTPSEFDVKYAALEKELRAADPDLLFFVRHDGGEDILIVTERAPVKATPNRVNAVLLGLTLLSTAAAGAMVWSLYDAPEDDFSWANLVDPAHLAWGSLTFALPLMAILGVHEMAHYIAARRHGLRSSLPFFIPMPPVLFPIGTLGAFISLRDPLPDRKALFDVGASGPLAGFAVAIPVVILGAFLTSSHAVEVPELATPEFPASTEYLVTFQERDTAILTWVAPENGTSTYSAVAPDRDDYALEHKVRFTLEGGETVTDDVRTTLAPNETATWTLEIPANVTKAEVRLTWDDGLIEFGDPLLVTALDPFFDNADYLTHPTFFAGWVGLLITGINLLPAGQLDGGHVARAVLGERTRIAAYLAIGLLFYLGFTFGSWLLMAAFILITGLHHPPPLNDRTSLDMKRKVLAGIVLAVLVLTFVPRPIIL